jgi:hypothetical protein
LGLDHFRASARSPDFQLIDCRRAKRIRRSQQHILSLRAKHLRELADRRSLARTVNADHQNYFRRAFNFVHRKRVCGVQNCQQLFLEQSLEFLYILNLLAVGLLAELAENFAVVLPKSAPMSVAWRSSSVPRSISLPNETTSLNALQDSRVRVIACFMRSMKLQVSVLP